MRRLVRTAKARAGLLLLLVLLCGPGVLPAPPGLTSTAPPWVLLESTESETVLRLDPPTPPRLSPVADARYRQIELDGFGLTDEVGAPQLPRWIGRIAIPEGAAVELEIVQVEWAPLPGVRPVPVPTREILSTGTDSEALGTGRERRSVWRESQAYQGELTYPTAPVRLGGTGALRHQHYVEIVYTPFVFDPRSGALQRAVNLVVRVRHTPPSGSIGPTRAPEPEWEPVYQQSFVNYSAGLRLRSAGRRGARPAVERAESTTLSPTVEIRVDADGLYRIGHAQISAASPALLAEDPRTWRLRDRGVEQPIRVIGESDGSFDPGDLLEFYGEARREPNMTLEVDLSPSPSVFRETDVGGTNVYVLSGGGANGVRVGTRDAAPNVVTPLPAETSFVTTAHAEHEDVFLPLGGDDAWYWGPRTNSSTATFRSEVLPLPGLAPVAYNARIQARVRGTTSSSSVNPDHLANFRLNGFLFPGVTFDGESVGALDQLVSQTGLLTDPATMEVQAGTVAGVAVQEFILNDFDITYRRTFASAGGVLRFDYPDGDHGFQVTGLPDAGIDVYEITDTVPGSMVRAPIRLTGVQITGGPPFTAAFEIHPTGTPNRSFVVVSGGGTVQPTALLEDVPSTLADPANGAGYLIVTDPSLIDQTPGSVFEQFVAAREAMGLPVKVAYIDDINDEFADSLPGPVGIHTFLEYAFQNWNGWDADGDTIPDPPRYVLFLGDGSVDYRARFNYGATQLPWFNTLPTAIFYRFSDFLGWYSSDNWLATSSGADLLPDYFIGRLATRSAAETEGVLAKILAHENTPPPGAWRSHVSFLSDEGYTPSESASFEQIAASLEGSFVKPPFTASHVYYVSDLGGNNPAAMKQAIRDEFDTGAALVDYVGHGAFNIWGLDSFFTAADIPSLANDGLEPFVVIENCLSGGFAWHFGPVIGESLVQTAGKGAIATFSPSGLSTTLFSELVAQSVFGSLFGPDKQRIVGAAAAVGLAALAADGNTVELMGYQLLGDPSTHLVLPAPAPASNLAATAGNTVVHLTWTASPDPVAGYRAYRATNPLGTYTLVNGSPVAALAYDDTQVQNALTYYYAIVAVDAGGFESTWSNRNTDCAVSGPDCVRAQPFNNVAPSKPTGVAALNPGTGGRITVSWAPNPEPDIKLYRVRYGTQPGVYTSFSEAMGTATQTTVAGLTDGVLYYAAVEAENYTALVSPLSSEVSAIPSLVQGIRPPATVTGLQVVIAAGDPSSLDLSWSAVGTDIYGSPITVSAYEIYRGTTPQFVPQIGSPLGSVAPPATTYRDTGAVLSPTSYYYLVLAVDAAGNRSGLGADLPFGISTLAVTLLPDGVTVHLSWPVVAITMSGGPTIIPRYEVHGAASPFSRAQTTSANLIASPTGTTFDHLPPSGKVFYYSVLPVDNRGALSPY
jgi:hypothetical protein